ncbi:hypothetical protein PHYPSEUDO_009322 [Phytophthora pseudosyringae]|uniref:Uncharacterized protein n=1 Tax=Phytophthora pseudosyringae TaxID=221518 RepID=A0A8T1VF80_9STRA|nr:hypothetical protein PHYPSEUDO_009322 [Phytophthora pseudosyringae]
MALAHVSAQANRLAEVQAVLTDRQVEQEAREAYGDSTALERRMDDRIQNVLMTLQDASLSQARAMAEAQLADQHAALRAMEERMDAALIDVQERAVRRVEQSVQSLVHNLNKEHQQILLLQQAAASDRHQIHVNLELLEKRTIERVEVAEEKASAVAVPELDARMGQALASVEDHVVRRAETHVLGLVKSLLEENRRQWQRQQLELQSAMEERMDQRLLELMQPSVNLL